MEAAWEADLLRELHEGKTSRNRNFETFRKPALKRVWKGYRRLLGLAVELGRRDVEVQVLLEADSQEREVEIVLETLRYRRRVRLAPWEFDFLRSELGAKPLAPPTP